MSERYKGGKLRDKNREFHAEQSVPGREKKRSRCPVSSKCGGCTMIDVPYAEQAAGKQEQVATLLSKFGPVQDIIRMKNPDHYRNKVTAIFGTDRRGHVVCGTYRAGSREIVPVKSCLIEDPKASRIIQTILRLLPDLRIRVYDPRTDEGTLRYVQVRTARATGQVLVTVVTRDALFTAGKHLVRALTKEHPEITTIVQNVNERTDAMILGEREKILYGPGYVEDVLCGRRFRISSQSFYQVNPIQTEKLYNIAVDCAGLSGKERVLDAYCGIGTIGILAAAHAKEVTGVEQNERAVEDACVNAAQNGLKNISFEAEDATAFMEELAEEAQEQGAGAVDVLFMDPPRSGATEAFLKAAQKLAPKKIVYVSCDPVTLARDLDYLTQHGYRMKKAVPVDMFPYTQHIESCVLLERVSNRKADSYVKLNVKMADYYRIKDSAGTGKCGGVTEDE